MSGVEALGIAASIIAVIQLTASVSTLSYGYIKEWKEAPENIRKLADELSSLSKILTYLQKYVDDNLQSPILQLSDPQNPLREGIRECKVDLSRLQLKLVPKQGSGSIRHRLKWPLKEAETSGYLSRMERYKGLIQLALNVDHISFSKAIQAAVEGIKKDFRDTSITLQDLRTASDAQDAWRQKEEVFLNAIEGQVVDVKRSIQDESHTQAEWRERENSRRLEEGATRSKKEVDEKRMKALNWVFPEVFDKTHLEISRMRQEYTGSWLFATPEFGDWFRNSDNPLLWGYGIPGAGKTFLSSGVIDYIQKEKSTAGYGIAYIYFNYKEQDQQLPVNVLASLVKQLASQLSQLPKEVEDLYDQLGPKLQRPTFEPLQNAFLATSKLFTRTFVVCDALDECHPENQRRQLLPLFHRMGKDGISLFLTSRQHPEDIQDSFRHSNRIELYARDEDIERYIKQQIGDHPRTRRLVLQARCERRIISDTISCSKGMFLFAHFNVRYLCEQTTARQILSALDRLKSSITEEGSLDPTYDRIMDIISQQHKIAMELALNVLSWLVKTRRTLGVDELRVGLAIEQDRYELDELDLVDRATLLEVCAGLVVVDENDSGGTIRLAHYTVQEYLLKSDRIPEDAEFKLAMACCTFLSFDIYAQGPESPESDGIFPQIFHSESWDWKGFKEIGTHHFLHYAATELSFHIGNCDEKLSTNLLLRFLASPSNLRVYFRAQLSWRSSSRCPISGLADYEASFLAACSVGHSRVARLLLEGADFSIPDNEGWSIVNHAKAKGHDAVVNLLIGQRANISTQDSSGRTALHDAAERGFESIVRLLLEKDADVSIQDCDSRTVLHCAAAGGSEGVVRLLLEKNADVSIQDWLCRTALHCAAGEGFEGIVRLLLEKDADVSIQDQRSRTALHNAAERGFERTVRLLLERGADVSIQDCDLRTALHFAAAGGFEETVRLLLEKNANISIQDSGSRTALHDAAEGGFEEIVKLLLEKNADVSIQDYNSQTALHRAAAGGSDGIVMLLLEKNADVLIHDYSGRTALHYAAAGGFEGIVRLLLEKNAGVSVHDWRSRTALHFAAEGGFEGIVRLLLEKNADVSIQDYNSQTALHCAVGRGFGGVVILLLEKNADVLIQDSNNQTVLHYAAKSGFEGITRLLLEKSANVSIPDCNRRTALHYAAERGFERIVRLLLEKDADVLIQDQHSRIALHYAAKGGFEEIVGLLLEKSANVLIQDCDRRTALHYAAAGGFKGIVMLLLEKNADILIPDWFGWTPLGRALQSGHEEIVTVLCEKSTNPSLPGLPN